jgi:parvulin-like peptidyl-prolyl isomerase
MPITVNNEEIPEAAVNAEVQRLRQEYERYAQQHGSKPEDSQLQEWSKQNLIERILLKQEAMSFGEPIPKKKLQDAYEKNKDRIGDRKKDLVFEQIEIQMRMERFIKDITKDVAAPSDKDIEDCYKENTERFTMPEQVHVAHIEKKLGPEADKSAIYVEMLNLREQIKQGRPFEEVAADQSDCPNHDLGYFPRGQMVQEFEDVVFNMEAGDVSDVFLTNFGYHIAKVHDKKPGGQIPLDEIRENIAGELQGRQQNEAVEAIIDQLKAKATITGA